MVKIGEISMSILKKEKKLRSILDKGDSWFYILNGTFLVIALVIVGYPLIYIISASFSSTSAVLAGRVWLYPVDVSLDGYEAVFRNPNIMSGFMNSFIYASLGTLFSLFLTIAAAYPLSRKDFRYKNVYMMIFAFTMFFNGGLIPTYLLVNSLGLVNTRGAIILVGALSVYNMIITRTFFQTTISDELIEAAQIDGMNDIEILFRVVLPLSKAILAVIALFYAVAQWNQYFKAFIYLMDKKLYPLQLILREILIQNAVNQSMMESLSVEEMEAKEGLAELLKYSLIVVASIPVMILYPFVQKYFVKGVMIGAIKG